MFTTELRDLHRARTQDRSVVYADFFNGDERQTYTEIDRCRATHADHRVRLNIGDYRCHGPVSFVVYNPSAVGT